MHCNFYSMALHDLWNFREVTREEKLERWNNRKENKNKLKDKEYFDRNIMLLWRIGYSSRVPCQEERKGEESQNNVNFLRKKTYF